MVTINTNEISELKNKIQELEELVFLYQKVFEKNPFAIQIFDQNGFSLNLNNSQKEYLQIPNLEESIGKFNVLSDPFAIANKASAIYKKIYDTGESYTHQYEYNFAVAGNNWDTRKDVRTYNEQIIPIIDASGSVKYVVAYLNDLSSQIKAEEALKANAFAYEKLYQNAPFPYQSLDADGCFLQVNKKWCLETGYTSSEVIGKPFIELLEEDSKVVFQIEFKQLLNQKVSNNLRLKLKTKQNDTILALFESCVSENREGEFVNTNSIFQNITEKEKNKQALLESEMRWRFAIEGNKDGLWDWNIETNDVYFSPQWKKMLGYQESEIEHTVNEWQTRVHPDDLEDTYAKVNAHLRGESEFYQSEHRLLCKDGTYKWILDRGKIIEYTPQGKPLRLIGTHTDISEHKKTESDLQKSEMQLLVAQQTAHIGHWEFNFEHTKLYWSDEVYRIFGLKPQEFEPTYDSFLEQVHPEDRELVHNAYTNSLANKEDYDIVHRLKPADGKIKYVNERCKNIYTPNGNLITSLGTVADITELIEKEHQISQQNAELKALNNTRDKFFSIIAHDLRSPFSAILGFSELIIEHIKIKKYDNIEEYSSLINKAAEQSYNLLNNLLQWSRIQTHKVHFDPQMLVLDLLLNKITYLLKPAMKKKKISFLLDVTIGFMLKADSFMLETILRNLLSNAIKYTHKGGEIVLKANRKEKEAIFSIKDNGIGVSEENIKRLFKIDDNFTLEGTENEMGSGLGLVLCKEFVEKHNGKIWVVSNEGKGAEFFFSLPYN